ncbi:MAG: hypothetical protein AAF933_02535 [Pseudomonadota bacterium]
MYLLTSRPSLFPLCLGISLAASLFLTVLPVRAQTLTFLPPSPASELPAAPALVAPTVISMEDLRVEIASQLDGTLSTDPDTTTEAQLLIFPDGSLAIARTLEEAEQLWSEFAAEAADDGGKTPDRPEIQRVTVFASGSAKSALSDANSDAANAAGTVSAQFRSGSTVWAAQINVLSTETSITSDFGTTLLAPATGSLSGLVDVRHERFHVYGGVSRATWSFTGEAPSDSMAATEMSADLSVLSLGALYAFPVVEPVTVEQRTYGLNLELGGALRVLSGDGAAESFDTFRTNTLGTADRVFYGIEAGANLVVDRLVAGVQFYWLFGDDAPGLTGGQVAGGISVAVPLLTVL